MFGGGADFVIPWGMFAGHDEGGGKVIKKNGSKLIEFYGSSSETALNIMVVMQIIVVREKSPIKIRGKIKDTVLNILGGLRSSCTYGCSIFKTIK